VAAINSVGDFILFLGKIGVMAATAAVGLLWFKVGFLCYNVALLIDIKQFKFGS
jgi:solute carrier family 44 protein 1 (choline transporter-like protein)